VEVCRSDIRASESREVQSAKCIFEVIRRTAKLREIASVTLGLRIREGQSAKRIFSGQSVAALRPAAGHLCHSNPQIKFTRWRIYSAGARCINICEVKKNVLKLSTKT
jgi:hypothetical protein